MMTTEKEKYFTERRKKVNIFGKFFLRCYYLFFSLDKRFLEVCICAVI